MESNKEGWHYEDHKKIASMVGDKTSLQKEIHSLEGKLADMLTRIEVKREKIEELKKDQVNQWNQIHGFKETQVKVAIFEEKFNEMKDDKNSQAKLMYLSLIHI